MANSDAPIKAIRATITELKTRPGRVGDYSSARLANVLDNLDPDYDHGVGSLVRRELESRQPPA